LFAGLSAHAAHAESPISQNESLCRAGRRRQRALVFPINLYFGNVFDSMGGFKFGFGPFVAPTTSGQISGIASGEGGPDQGSNQLVVFSNYDCCQPGEGHFGTDLVETIVF
jgi:hypothetical protein